MTPAALEVEHLSKTFVGQRVLNDVTLAFAAGSTTALVGHNGSGKSTLIKILAGVHAPDRGGRVAVQGKELSLPMSSHEVRRLGLRFVHQDLGLLPAMSIADNFGIVEGFQARSPVSRIRRRRLEARVVRALDLFEIDESPRRLIAELGPTTRAMVAIARAVQSPMSDSAIAQNSVLVLDEPTAALPASDVQRIFDAIRVVREAGGVVIYVTHRLDEALAISDSIAALRNGVLTGTWATEQISHDGLFDLIVAEGVTPELAIEGSRRRVGETVLETTNLSGNRLADVSLEVKRGEIVGVTGLTGSGCSELMRLLSGAQRPSAGCMLLHRKPVTLRSPRAAIANGIGYVSQNRREEAIVHGMTVQENMTLGDISPFWRRWRLDHGRETRAVAHLKERFGVKPLHGNAAIETLSGGNQQKVVLARVARRNPTLLLLDEPTQGIDVGARAEVARIITDLARDGCAVLVSSTDHAELAALADRVLVLDRGRVVDAIPRDGLSEERLSRAAARDPDEPRTARQGRN